MFRSSLVLLLVVSLLSAQSDVSHLSTIAPETGAVVQSQQSKNNELLNVAGFGASVLNSYSVNDIAINKAIAVAAAEGRDVHFPPGVFHVKNLVIPTTAPNVKLGLIGESGTFLVCHNNDHTDCLSAISATFSNPVYTIRSITFFGPDYNSNLNCPSINSGNGLRISGAATTALFGENIKFYGFCGTGYSGSWLDNVEGGTIHGLLAWGNNIGVKLTGSFNANTIENMSVALNTQYGCYILNASGNTFNTFNVESNVATGCYMSGVQSNTFNSYYMEGNNTSLNSSAYGLVLDSTGNYVEAGNTFNGFSVHSVRDNVYMHGLPGYAITQNVFNGGFNSSGPLPLFIEDGPYIYSNTIQGPTNAAGVQGINGGGGYDYICPAGDGYGSCTFPINGLNTMSALILRGFSFAALNSSFTGTDGTIVRCLDCVMANPVTASGGGGGLVFRSGLFWRPLSMDVESVGTITSASSITVLNHVNHIAAGVSPISTILPPAWWSTVKAAGCVELIPDFAFSTNTSGNIALATTAVINRKLSMCYDSGTNKWFPSY